MFHEFGLTYTGSEPSDTQLGRASFTFAGEDEGKRMLYGRSIGGKPEIDGFQKGGRK